MFVIRSYAIETQTVFMKRFEVRGEIDFDNKIESFLFFHFETIEMAKSKWMANAPFFSRNFFIYMYILSALLKWSKWKKNFLPSKLKNSCKWNCSIIQKIQTSIFQFYFEIVTKTMRRKSNGKQD